MKKILAIVACWAHAGLAVPAVSLRAQPAPTEWTAVSRSESGDCEGGAFVEVLESPGTMRLRFHVNEMRVIQLTIPLDADGSGRGEFHGKVPHSFANIGRLVHNDHEADENRGLLRHEIVHVPAGSGKRALESRQSRSGGDCRWLWVPR